MAPYFDRHAWRGHTAQTEDTFPRPVSLKQSLNYDLIGVFKADLGSQYLRYPKNRNNQR